MAPRCRNLQQKFWKKEPLTFLRDGPILIFVMKKIEKLFTSKGFEFKQVMRDGDMAIYEKHAAHSKCSSYELIYITSHNGYEIGGNKIPPSEVYPSDTQWGTYGWTYVTLKDAKENLKVKSVVIEKHKEIAKTKKTKQKRSAKYEETYKVLTCPITNQTRKAPLNYLVTKSQKYGVSLDTIVKYYISRSGLKLLRMNSVNHADKANLLQYNGKGE